MGSTLDFFRKKAREEEEEKERQANKAGAQNNENNSGGTTQKKNTSTLDFFREEAVKEREENPERFSSSSSRYELSVPRATSLNNRSAWGDTVNRMSARAEMAKNATEKQPTIAELSVQLQKAQEEEKAARKATAKYNGSGSWRYLTKEDIANQKAAEQILEEKTARRKQLQAQIEAMNNQRRYGDKTYGDNFFGQFGASYTQGRLQQDSSLAWNDYLNDPSDTNRMRAEAADAVLADFQRNNKNTLDDDATLPWVSQSLAGYLPQFADQAKYSAVGGLTGATLGSAVPGLGTALGAKAGIVAGSGKYSYDTMRGAAYKGLIEAGLDESTARAAASDEAIISSLIEMADTGVDIATLGVGKLISLVGKGGVKAVAGEAAETAAKKFLKRLAGYGLNIGGEMLEEASQEAVSIANEKRQTGDTGVWDLAKSAAGTAWDAVRGEDDEAAQRIWEAAKEGGKIAAMMGGATSVAAGAVNTAIENNTGAQMRSMGGDETVAALIASGLESEQGTESRALAEKLKAKVDAGQSVSNTEVGRLYQANVRAMEAERANISQASEDNSFATESLEDAAREAVQPVREVSEKTITQPTQRETPAREAVSAKQSTPYNAMAVNNPERQQIVKWQRSVEEATGYGKRGSETFVSIVESSGRDVNDVRMEFQSAYEAGLTNLPRERANLRSPIQEEAYNAGRLDYIADMNKPKSTAAVSNDAGFDRAHLPADVTEAQYKTVDMLAKAAGVRVRIAKGLKGNAEIASDGTVLIDETFQREVAGKQRSIVFYAAHEIGMHRLMQLAPEEGRAFINAVIQDANAGLAYGQSTVTELRQRSYAAQDVHLTTAGAMEEVAADSILGLYDSEAAFYDAIDRVINGKDEQAKRGARKFKEILDDIVRKLKQIVAKLTGKERAEAQQTLSEVEQLRGMYEKALKAAVENAAHMAERAGESRGNIETQYSAKEDAYDAEGSRENRKAFAERNERRGWKTQTFGETAIAYVPVSRAEAGGIAEGIQRELNELGIRSFYHDGLQANIDGTTKDMKGEAHTIPGHVVGINARTTKNVKEVAGHEAFHYWMATRGEFENILADNIQDYAPETILFMAETVMQYEENGHIDNALLHEEFRARIAGMLHADRRTAGLRKMLRDYDAVKAAWNDLVAKNAGTVATEGPEAGTKYSLVTDEETLDFLNNQEWVKVYRAMYQDETGLYPPMGSIQGGKRVEPVKFKSWYQADENPQLIKFEVPKRFLAGELNNKGKPRKTDRFLTPEEIEANRDVLYGSHKANDVITLSSGNTLKFKDLKPKFELQKADGGTDVPAAYNPYFHTSLSALNDQFSTAYKRPGLVVVEGYIPKSELSSGYKALYAKDAVGETTWKSGVVAKDLKGDKARKVFLSRWFQAERVVPDAEAAKMIASVLEGEELKVPWNVVTPALREALEAEGVDIDYDVVYAGTSFADFQAENEGKKFSLKSPVEETKTLVALHNLTEEKLRKAIALGGFPMPSIAVTRMDIPHTNFGDITLVMNKSTADPKASRKNTVYSADAWTPTFPQIEYEADPKAQKKLSNLYYDLGKTHGYDLVRPLYGYAQYLDDELARHGGVEGILERLRDDNGMKQVYLAAHGKQPIETIYRENVTRMNEHDIERYDHLIDRLGKDVINELVTRGDEKPIDARKRWAAEHGEELKAAYRAYLTEVGGIEDSVADDVMEHVKIGELLREVTAARRYLTNGPEKVETVEDWAATNDAIRAAVDQSAYEVWLDELFGSAVKDTGISNNKPIFTDSGNRRSFKQTHYPVTLENIAKAMAAQNGGNSKHVSGFVGIKSLRAGTAVRFKSIAHMHELEGRLKHLTQEEADAINDALGDRLSDITRRIYNKKKHGQYVNEFVEYDVIGNILMELTELDKYTVDSIQKVFGQYQYNLGNELAADIRDLLFDVTQMPVNIFEAKPERAVRFDEVLAAVLPDDADQSLREQLEQMGLNVLTYKADDEASRIAAVNSVEGAKFSLKEDEGERMERELNSLRQQREDLQDEIDVAYLDDIHQSDINKLEARMAKLNADIDRLVAQERKAAVKTSMNDILANLSSYRRSDLESMAEQISDGNWDGYEDMTRDELEEALREEIDRLDLSPLEMQSKRDGLYVRPVSKMQFSLKEQENLLEENAKLRKVYDTLREQFTVTEFEKVDKKTLDQFTKSLLRDWKSGADINETRAALYELYTFIRTEMQGDEPNLDEMEKRCYEVALPIIQSVAEMDDTAYQEYKALRDTVRTTGITLDKSLEHDLGEYESLNDFRKAYIGRIRLVNDGTPVDKFYQSLAYNYPGLFDESMHTNQADMLVHIGQVLDDLRPTEVNPYAHNMRETATWLAADIMTRIYDLPQAKPTFADKVKGKIPKSITGGLDEMGELIDQQQTRLEKAENESRRTQQELEQAKAYGNSLISSRRALERELERKNEEIAEIIKANREKMSERAKKSRETGIKYANRKHAESMKRAGTRKKEQDMRARVIRHAEQMSKKLLRGTDQSHVPEGLKGAVAELLAAINLESNYTKDPVTGGYKKSDEGLPTRRTEEFRKVREQYEAIASNNEYGMVLDPNLLGVPTEGIPSMLDKVIAMRDIRLADMNLDQLETIYDVLRVMEHSILMAGKMLARTRWSTIHEAAGNFMDDTESRKTKTRKSAKVLDIETPYTFFSHYGEAGTDFYRMLRNAQDDEQRLQDQLRERLGEVVSLEDRQKAEKDIVKYKTQRGVELTLSKAHIMNIYLLNNRKQAQQHLLSGGIVQPEIGKVRKGTEAVLLTEYDVANIISKLSDKERRMADNLQKLTLLMAEWGNKASMTVYGIKKFNDPDYWTIHSADIGINQTVEQGQNKPRSIANMGSAKAVIPEARNTLTIDGAFDVFDRHASDMMCYSAWLAPMEDANRLFNYKYRDENWNPTGKTMKGILDRVGGEGSTKYWLRLMEDIQNGLSAPADTASEQGVMKAIGNVKKAAVSGNIRVIVQQPTAYARAAVVLGPDTMLAALGKDVAVKPMLDGWKKAVEYAPIAARKAAGGYEVAANPKQLAELLYQPKSKSGKAVKFAKDLPLAGAGLMDELTWGTIWNACEIQVGRDIKNLKKGSAAFYQAVAELFTEVIDQTQVVDGVLQRSQAMRSGSNFMKQMTSFTGEPTQGANIIMRAYDQLRYEQDKLKRGKTIKKLGRAVSVYMFTAVLNAFAQSLIDSLRDDDDDEYWNKVWAAFSGINGKEETWWDFARNIVLAGNVVNNVNPMSWVPVWKDVLSVIQGYSVERMDAASLGDFFDSLANVVKTLEGDGKYTTGYAALKSLTLGHKLLGGSSYNYLRDIEGIVRTFQVETDDYWAQYETMKLMTKPVNNLTQYAALLFKAYQNDQKVYKAMYNDLLASGVDADDIKTKMESLMKKDQGVKKVEDLEQRYLSPGEQPKWDSAMKVIRKSGLWKDASEKHRDELEDKLYGLVTESKGSEEMREKIADGAAYGLDETEYLLYTLALDMYDQPNKSGKLGGTPTSEEKAAAIAALGDLSDGEIAFLWDTDNGYDLYDAGIDMRSYVEYVGTGGSVSADKLIDIHSQGIDEDTYFDFLDMLKEVDQPTESGKLGSYTQDEAAAAVAALEGLTRNERAALWQSVNKSWKDKNNPWR